MEHVTTEHLADRLDVELEAGDAHLSSKEQDAYESEYGGHQETPP
jgi:hypothetical protein